MTIRWLAVAAILTGCDYAPIGSDDADDTGAASACPIAGWEATTDAELTFTSFILDGISVAVGFDAATEYDDGPAACADPEGTGASWAFDAGDVPLGRMTVQSTTAGPLELGVDGSLTIDLYGADSPTSFTGAHFLIGGWTVSSLTPTFATDLAGGQAQNGARTLGVSFFAEATP